jgi:lipopolysaccharide transport system ATP-binding protein
LNVIQVENISKLYRLGQVGTGSIFNDVNRWWHGVRGKEDPYMRVGEENDRTQKGKGDYVWALKDINFEVAQGEVLGIIGRNGAGKSTLLKILSRTTAPTTGTIKVKGRIASLLEVGTGFHPELSGRDNIFMNGTILGMNRSEIKLKFDEIVEFAGVTRYLDTPVKRYSSGMYVRLAFAVAAHLESEILIVDEVLAVGDAEFQKKCLGKMKDVSERQGRTVLFVSHNIDSHKELSQNIILLQNGKLSLKDDSSKVLENYLLEKGKVNPFYECFDDHTNNLEFLNIWVENQSGEIRGEIDVLDDFFICMRYKVQVVNLKIYLGINIYTETGVHVLSSHDLNQSFRNENRDNRLYFSKCKIPKNYLNEGVYKISVAILDSITNKPLIYIEEKITIKIFDTFSGFSARGNFRGIFPGIVRPILDWQTI